MRILWVPQLSSTHKIEDKLKWNLTADSNWRHASEWCKGFKMLDKNNILDMIIPKHDQLVDVMHLDEVDANNFIELDFYTSAFSTRFDFKFEDWLNILDNNYDVIWINDPCLVMNIKSVYNILQKDLPIIVSYNHWPDSPISPKTPKSITYYYRQIEGALYSDLHFVYTNFSKDFLLKGARKHFNNNIIEILKKKVYAAYCPITPYEGNIIDIKDKPSTIVAYTQRLSDLPYYRKSLLNAVKILRMVNNKGFNVKLRIFNHARKPIPEEVRRYTSFIEIVEPKDKIEYYTLLRECSGSLDCYNDERVWSISQNEACNLGVMPILKYIDGYKEMYPKSFDGFYNTMDEAVKIIIRLDKKHKPNHSVWARDNINLARNYMIEKFNNKAVVKLALDRINKIIDEKEKAKLPRGKYVLK